MTAEGQELTSMGGCALEYNSVKSIKYTCVFIENNCF